jgi:hypothetical protein
MLLTFMAALAAIPAPQVWSPEWLHHPNGQDFAVFYPPAAMQAKAPGRAAIRCFVGDSGKLESCVLLADEPEGAEFGASALKLAKYFQLKLGVGGAEPGSVLVMRIDFCLPEACPIGLNVWPGDSAYAVRVQVGPPKAGATVFPCPSATEDQRKCIIKRFVWKSRPDQQKLIGAVAGADQIDGHSLMECRPGDGGILTDCKIEHATARSEAILRALSTEFQTPDVAVDKTSIAGAKILFDVDWGMLHKVLYPGPPSSPSGALKSNSPQP